MIDENVSWKNHVNMITNKLSKIIGILHRLEYIYPKHILFRSDDGKETLPSQRRLQFICSYFIIILCVSTNLFVFSLFHVVLFSIW